MDAYYPYNTNEREMKNILLTLTCLLAFAVSAFATETGERVLTLPADQGAWYLTTFGDANDAEFIALTGWLESDGGLAKLKTQVRYHEYTTDQIRYQRYAKNIPALPCIRLQNEKGLVVSEFFGDNIPAKSIDLYRGIKSDIQNKTAWGCPRRGCPSPKPEPPPPDTKPVPEPPVGPPVFEEDEPEPLQESNLWILLALVAAAISGGISVAREYRAKHVDKS
jgi:hypothetical protein